MIGRPHRSAVCSSRIRDAKQIHHKTKRHVLITAESPCPTNGTVPTNATCRKEREEKEKKKRQK